MLFNAEISSLDVEPSFQCRGIISMLRFLQFGLTVEIEGWMK